jgi:hypothetical protein
MPGLSLTAQCSATLPSATRNQCDCWTEKRSPVDTGCPRVRPRACRYTCPVPRHRLPVGDGLLDIKTVVGEDAEEPVGYVLDRDEAALVLGGGRVVEV